MQNRRILLASSEPYVITTYERLFKSWGCEVFTATWGGDVLSLIKKHSIDVAVLSINLEGSNGFEVTRIIRQCMNSSELPVVIYADADSRSHRSISFKAGANIFAFEPIDNDRLHSVIMGLFTVKEHYDETELTALSLKAIIRTLVMDPELPQGDDQVFKEYDYLIRSTSQVASITGLEVFHPNEVPYLVLLIKVISDKFGQDVNPIKVARSLLGPMRVSKRLKMLEEYMESPHPLRADCPVDFELIRVTYDLILRTTGDPRHDLSIITEMHEQSEAYNKDITRWYMDLIKQDALMREMLG